MNAARPLRWRIVFAIQRLITFVFPPLHSIRWKLFIAFVAVMIAPACYFAFHMLSRGGVHYTSSREQRLIHDFIRRSLGELMIPALIGLAMAILVAWGISFYITRVITSLAARADRIAAGESGVRLETWTQSELGALARAVEKMRRKLEGKAYVEAMAANLSHELKTPLASIRGAAEVLEDGAIEDPIARKKFLTNIQAEVQRLDRIVSELLKLSRLETQATEAAPILDVAPVFAEVAARFGERAREAGVVFSAELPGGPLPVRILESQLQQLLNNLLENALQFTLAGRAARLSVAVQDRQLAIRVSDEGAGIEPELLPKIFDRFFTTDNPRTGARGTGLGLAIVHSIVTRNGGTISVQSEPGHGSEFTARLPA